MGQTIVSRPEALIYSLGVSPSTVSHATSGAGRSTIIDENMQEIWLEEGWLSWMSFGMRGSNES